MIRKKQYSTYGTFDKILIEKLVYVMYESDKISTRQSINTMY